jgi:predicted transcriptional regulator
MSVDTILIDLDSSLIARLDSVASAESLDRGQLVAQAIDQFLAVEEYHLACIREGIRQADEGMLTPLEDVIAESRTWGREA